MEIGGTTNKPDQRAQPAGVPAHGAQRGGAKQGGPDQVVLDLHARLCELVTDPEARATLLRVPVSVDTAWLAGRMLPVLRAQRKALEAAVNKLEREQSTAS